MISVNNLQFSYTDAPFIEDISFDVFPACFYWGCRYRSFCTRVCSFCFRRFPRFGWPSCSSMPILCICCPYC